MRALLPCLALLLAGPLAAQPVVRCEGTDGRVTYTNEPCPGSARKARTVDDTPAVRAQREAPARSAGKDGEKDSGKDSNQHKGSDTDADKRNAAGRASVRPSEPRVSEKGRIEATHSASNLTPAQQIEQLDQERARQRAQCVRLERSIGFARTDVDTALGSQRASAELQLRRLQDEHRLLCPAQR